MQTAIIALGTANDLVVPLVDGADPHASDTKKKPEMELLCAAVTDVALPQYEYRLLRSIHY